MNWLEDLNKKTVYKYVVEGSDLEPLYATRDELLELTGSEPTCEPGDKFSLEDENGKELVFSYAGFIPRKLDMMTKVTFEKNGRKGIAVNFGDGKIAKRSQTKENYMNGKGTASVLTKACKEASEKAQKEYVHKRLKSTLHEMKRDAHAAKQKAREKK